MMEHPLANQIYVIVGNLEVLVTMTRTTYDRDAAALLDGASKLCQMALEQLNDDARGEDKRED